MNHDGREMLCAWQEAMGPQTPGVPSREQLDEIADRGRVVPEDGYAAWQWRHTIAHLLKQAGLGVKWPAVVLGLSLLIPQHVAADELPVSAPDESWGREAQAPTVDAADAPTTRESAPPGPSSESSEAGPDATVGAPEDAAESNAIVDVVDTSGVAVPIAEADPVAESLSSAWIDPFEAPSAPARPADPPLVDPAPLEQTSETGTVPPSADGGCEGPIPQETELPASPDPAEIVSAEVADAEVADAEVPDADVPDAEVPDAEVPELAAALTSAAAAGIASLDIESPAIADSPAAAASAAVPEPASVDAAAPAAAGATRPRASLAATPEANRLRALQEWADEQQTAGRVPKAAVSQANLRILSRYRFTSPAEIVKRVSGLTAWAAEILAVLAEADSVYEKASDDQPGEDGIPKPLSASEPGAESASAPPAPSGASASLGQSSTAPDPLRERVASLTADQFVEAYSLAPDSDEVEGRITVVSKGSELHLSWPEATGPGITVYRLVIGDGERPLNPQFGATAAITVTGSAVVEFVTRSVVAFLQVWSYAAPTLEEAVEAQPDLVAEAVVVRPITNVVLHADPGQVRAEWEAPDGASCVRLYRFKGHRAPTHHRETDRILEADDNLGGFFDFDATGAPVFVYRAVVEANIAGSTQLSEPVDVTVEVPADLSPVVDLACEVTSFPARGHAGQVTLTYTAPEAGQVRVYRIHSQLPGGLAGRPFRFDALPEAQFSESRRVVNPVHKGEDGRVAMKAVRWTADESVTYFVPVTILGHDAMVGSPVRLIGMGAPGDPRLRERVHEQVVTFEWPSGATEVSVHLAAVGDQSAEITAGAAFAQIDATDYERRGGWRLQLPNSGHDLDLVLTGVKGNHRGPSSRITFSPLVVMEYQLSAVRAMGLFGKPKIVFSAWVTHGRFKAGCPPLVLVYRPDRLPLTPRDGHLLPVVPDGSANVPPAAEARQAAAATSPAEAMKFRAEIPGGHGYLRVFISASVPLAMRRRIALIDPPVWSLKV